MGKIRDAYGNELRLDAEEAENTLFGVQPTSRSSVRGAYELVYGATSLGFDSGDMEGPQYAEGELERYYTRARRTGDSALQTAVFHVAIERGVDSVRDRYLASDKEKARNWERYVQARALKDNFEDAHANFERTVAGVGVLRPPEEL